jgi:hypothetical protein
MSFHYTELWLRGSTHPVKSDATMTGPGCVVQILPTASRHQSFEKVICVLISAREVRLVL